MRELTRKRRPTCGKIEALSPLPYLPTHSVGKAGDGIHLVSPQVCGDNRLCPCRSDRKPFVSCACPFLVCLYEPGSPNTVSLGTSLAIFFTLHPKYFTNLGQRRRGLFYHTLKFNCCLAAIFNITQIFKYNLKFAPKEGAYLVCKICVYVLCPCEHSSAKEFLRV